MKIVICGIFIILAIPYGRSTAQNDSLSNELELENSEEEVLPENDESTLTNYLEDLSNNPVNINRAEIRDLLKVPYLTINDVTAILKYRKQNGPMTPGEILKVPGIEFRNLRRAMTYLTTEDYKPVSIKDKLNISWSDVSLNFRSRILQDLQERKGFRDGSFQGTPYKTYNKLRLEMLQKYSIGCTIEKDAGERIWYDYYSIYLYMKDLGIIEKLIIGDYDLEFFEGLVLGNAYKFGKGAEINSLNNGDRNIRAHTSAEENRFFRGGALSLIISAIRLSLFYSKNYLDAVIDSSTGEITSLPVDGLHRTGIENLKSDKTVEEFVGGRMDFQVIEKLSIGLLFYNSVFAHPLRSELPYGKNGTRFSYSSIGYNYSFGRLIFQGEICSDKNGTISTINSINYELNEEIRLILSIRNYPANYISLHGNGFGETAGDASNERGIYGAVNIKTSFGRFSSYYDLFQIPGPTYFNPVPSSGRDFLIRYLLKTGWITINAKYRNKEKEKYSSYWGKNTIENEQRAKLELEYDVTKNFSVKGKGNYTCYSREMSNYEIGYSYSMGVKLITKFKLHLDLNFVIFRTDSYNSSIYEYENELKGLSGMNLLFGSGTRWFIVLNYFPVKSLGISLKYSETIKSGIKTIGSGETEISGNLDNKIKAQIDFGF